MTATPPLIFAHVSICDCFTRLAIQVDDSIKLNKLVSLRQPLINLRLIEHSFRQAMA